MNGSSYTVIGVAPEGFFGTEIIAAPELCFPMAMQAQIEVGNEWLEERDSENLFLQGRLKDGVRIAQAQTALNSIAAQLEREYPDINEGKKFAVTPPGLRGPMKGAVIGFTGVLMGVVAFVLLLACLNLANLLLARAIDRRKEISVRLALGASRMRIVRQLLAESMLLSVTSGIAGCLLAYWLLRLAQLIKPPTEFPLLIDLHMDYRVFIFTALVSIITGVLFGLLPALQATKVDVLPALKDEASLGGYRRSWLKNGLIVMQLALALVLLVGGGLMLRALERAQTLDLGFNPQAAVEVSFDLRLQGYDEARGREFQKLLLERVRNIPGVQYAGMVDLAPIDLHFSRGSIYIEGQTVERNVKAPRAMTNRVSPGYLRAMGVRLVKGRDFTEQDTANSPVVAIVNETFAKRFWPGQDAIGKRFSRGGPDAPRMQVVGVVQDGRYSSLSEEPQPYFCTSMLQNYSGTTTMIVRSERDSQKMIASLRAELLRMDPQMPLSSAKPLAARMALPLLPARISATLLGSFGMLALALVAIGIYGIMSYAVSRRTHEIGIRVALGAQPSHLLKLTIAQGMSLAFAGVLIGMPAALLLARVARRMLYGVSTMDPITYAAVTVILVAVALLACYIPARRATHIDPMTALRNE